jgi:hypothetical protein
MIRRRAQGAPPHLDWLGRTLTKPRPLSAEYKTVAAHLLQPHVAFGFPWPPWAKEPGTK